MLKLSIFQIPTIEIVILQVSVSIIIFGSFTLQVLTILTLIKTRKELATRMTTTVSSSLYPGKKNCIVGKHVNRDKADLVKLNYFAVISRGVV